MSHTALLDVDKPVLRPVRILARRVRPPVGHDNLRAAGRLQEPCTEARAIHVLQIPSRLLVAVAPLREAEPRHRVGGKRTEALRQVGFVAVGGRRQLAAADAVRLLVRTHVVGKGEYRRTRPRNC